MNDTRSGRRRLRGSLRGLGTSRKVMMTAVVVLGAMALPGVASGAPVPAGRVSFSTGSLPKCSRVRTSAVSSIMGYTVPAPTQSSQSNSYNKKANIYVSDVTCAYGKETSVAGLKTLVLLDYERLSKSISLSELEKEINASGIKDFRATTYNGLSYPGILYTIGEEGITIRGLVAVDGDQVVGAALYDTTSNTKLVALTKLTINSFL